MKNKSPKKDLDHFKQKYQDKNNTKNGILSIVGAIFHSLSTGSIIVILAFLTYLISYLRALQPEGQKTLTMQHTYFFGPIFAMTMSLFMPLCGVIEFKLGLQRAIILGALINMIAGAILYFSTNYFLDLFTIFLFGIGNCISIAISGKNAVMYFFSKKGSISGFLSLVASLLNSGINLFGEKVIINPDSIDAYPDGIYVNSTLMKFLVKNIVLNENDTNINNQTNNNQTTGSQERFYPYFVSKNILNYFLFLVACIGISTLLAILFIVPYDQKLAKKFRKAFKSKKENKENKENKEPLLPDEDEDKEEKNKDENKEEEKNKDEKNKDEEKNEEEKNKDEEKNINDENLNEEEKKLPPEGPFLEPVPNAVDLSITAATVNNYTLNHIKTAAKSGRVWRFIIMNLCSGPLNNLILTTWRPIAISHDLPTLNLQYINSYRSIITCVVTPLLGFLADKVPFRILKVILAIINTTAGFLFSFSFNNIYFFTLIVLMNGVSFSGNLAINPPHFMKVFGMKYFIEISGIIGLTNAIISPLCSFFAFFIEKLKGDDKENDLPYKIMFFSGAALSVVEIVLAMFETEDKFDY